jgi:hypothetical protein
MLVLLATGLLLAAPPAVSGEHLADAHYVGTHAGGGSFGLTVSADGQRIQAFHYTHLPCEHRTLPGSNVIVAVPIAVDHTFALEGGLFGPAIRGSFVGPGIAQGSLFYRDLSLSAAGCSSDTFTWSATAALPQLDRARPAAPAPIAGPPLAPSSAAISVTGAPSEPSSQNPSDDERQPEPPAGQPTVPTPVATSPGASLSAGLPTPTSVPPAPAAPRRLDLETAESGGLVRLGAFGAGLTAVQLTLESRAPEPLAVVIPVGTIFQAQSATTQSMVVIEQEVVHLTNSGSRQAVRLAAACINMDRDVPREADALALRRGTASGDLARLVNVADFGNESWRVRQFAVWTITDNPSRGGYAAIGARGATVGPSGEELGRVRDLLVRAGLLPNRYRAFR